MTTATHTHTDTHNEQTRHTPHFLTSPLPLSLPVTRPVPTIAPSNVQAEAINSTAIRFTWTAPNPQFINGINQGYKVSVQGHDPHLPMVFPSCLRGGEREWAGGGCSAGEGLCDGWCLLGPFLSGRSPEPDVFHCLHLIYGEGESLR